MSKQKLIYKQRIFNNETKIAKKENVQAKEIPVDCEIVAADAAATKSFTQRTLAAKLQTWIIENKPTHASAQSLLKILNEDGLKVPVSVATLLGRERRVIVKHVAPGIYCFFIYSFIFLSISAVQCKEKLM